MSFIDPVRISPTKITLSPPVSVDTGFNPATNGFAFDNEYDNNVFRVISAWTGLPMPDLSLLRTDGLCGGMCYAALDYFLTGVPLPRLVTSKPQPSTRPNEYALWHHIVTRQGDSMPTLAAKIAKSWATPWFIESAGDTFRDGLTTQLDLLIAGLRRGRPVPIGLMNNTFTLTDNHQVLAYRVEMVSGTDRRTARIFVYDPNQPNMTAIVSATPGQNTFMTTGSASVWRTFFTDTTYQIHNPPRLLPDLGQPAPGAATPSGGRVIAKPTVNPPPPTANGAVGLSGLSGPAKAGLPAGGTVGPPGVIGTPRPGLPSGATPANPSGIFGRPAKPIKKN